MLQQERPSWIGIQHGSLNVPIEHHPTVRYMVYNGYYKVMSNIPKMGHLPTPVQREMSCFLLRVDGLLLPGECENQNCPKYTKNCISVATQS